MMGRANPPAGEDHQRKPMLLVRGMAQEFFSSTCWRVCELVKDPLVQVIELKEPRHLESATTVCKGLRAFA